MYNNKVIILNSFSMAAMAVENYSTNITTDTKFIQYSKVG